MLTDYCILFALLFVAKETLGEFNCAQQIKDCTCSESRNDGFQVDCPNIFNPLITVKVSSDRAQILCTNSTELVPQLTNTESLKYVDVFDCYLPDGLQDVVRKLNLDEVKNLTLQMCADPAKCFNKTLLVTKDYVRGFESLRVLDMSRNSIAEIEEDAFYDMPDLIAVDLHSNDLTSLPPIFNFAPNLTLIDLSRNNIANLSEDVFYYTPKLKYLYLWKNKLNQLSDKMFTRTENLTLLELSYNELEEVPENLLRPLANLKQVSFIGNQLTKLPEKLFRSNFHLNVTRLARNKISYLPPGIFANLTGLEQIDLSVNLLESIPRDLFKDLTKLKYLNLEHNLLDAINNSFSNSGHLETLILSSNKINDLSGGVFNGLNNLKKLHLGHNALTVIKDKLPLRNLQVLELQNNRISAIEMNAFFDLRNLKVLNLSFNNLKTSSSYDGWTSFNYLLAIEKVDLRRNELVQVPVDLILKTNLQLLDLSNNSIALVSLSDVKTVSLDAKINLQYNKIETVLFDILPTKDFDEEETTRTVYLSYNPISCNCTMYGFSRYIYEQVDTSILKKFQLDYTDLTCSSPVKFAGREVRSVKPEELTCAITNNCPQGCVCERRSSSKSLIINCSYRNLTTAPPIELTLSGISQTEVHLNGNFLTKFSVESSGYQNVTHLYLQHNQLRNITWVPPKIQTLVLDNNDLTVLDYEVLSALNKSSTLNSLSLNNNPWNCDCNALNFTIALRENLIKKITLENLTCSDSGLNLLHLTSSDLCETNNVLIVILGATLFTILIALAFAMALYYKYNQEIKVWLFAHDMFLWFITEEDLDREKEYDAFLSYSHKDEHFIIKHLLPELEGGKNPYKLCIHVRDWMPGEFITTQITQSVENSRRTIVVLSPNFLQSVWSKMEFRTAHTKAMSEGRARVIVILYGEIDINDDLDEELKVYLKTNTYVKWGDPWFWQKLKYALPHIHTASTYKNKKMENIMVTIDKMDLINSPATPNVGTPPAVSLDPLLLKGDPLLFKTGKSMKDTPPTETGLVMTYNN